LSSTLLRRAFEIESTSQCFHDVLFYKPRLRNSPSTRTAYLNSDQPTYYKRNKIYFDRLSNAFRNVYPGIYEALEKKWQYDVRSETHWLGYEEKEGLKRQHSWREASIYKLGKFYFCIKCHIFVSEKFMKYYKKRKKE
jgi:hypothetical protein